MVTAVIPARYGSSRFPGKPLARSTGKFLIQHVCERVAAAQSVDRCIVATDDDRIMDAVASFGGEAIRTRADHPSGTDRIAEVARTLGAECGELVLNVQGDEPEIEPSALDALIARMQADPQADCGTLACPFPPHADPRDPNAVKVVCGLDGVALYFSRALVPFPRDGFDAAVGSWMLHLGVYAFRREFLLEYAGWETTPLERLERLEQLRVLEHGRRMLVEPCSTAFVGVDTKEDYESFVQRWRARNSAETA